MSTFKTIWSGLFLLGAMFAAGSTANAQAPGPQYQQTQLRQSIQMAKMGVSTIVEPHGSTRGFAPTLGERITNVVRGPAARAGLEVGDVIAACRINGFAFSEITSRNAIPQALRQASNRIDFKVLNVRNGQYVYVTVFLNYANGGFYGGSGYGGYAYDSRTPVYDSHAPQYRYSGYGKNRHGGGCHR